MGIVDEEKELWMILEEDSLRIIMRDTGDTMEDTFSEVITLIYYWWLEVGGSGNLIIVWVARSGGSSIAVRG